MFCTQCGANNPDNAMVCGQCGRTFQAATPPPPLQATGVVMPAPGTTVENYLVFAILATVLCCLPAGIPAIVYPSQVNGKLQAGDYAGAQLASKNAKMWCMISAGISVGAFLIWGVLIMLGAIGGAFHN